MYLKLIPEKIRKKINYLLYDNICNQLYHYPRLYQDLLVTHTSNLNEPNKTEIQISHTNVNKTLYGFTCETNF